MPGLTQRENMLRVIRFERPDYIPVSFVVSESVWSHYDPHAVEELLESLDMQDPEDTEWEHKTLGEWVYEHFDLIPAEGSSFLWHTLRVTVAGLHGRRIVKLRVERLPEEAPKGGETE